MKRWPAYAKYKPSGIDWLGDIPEHWKVSPLRYLLEEKLKYGANESAIDEDYTQPRFVRITDVAGDGSLHPDTFKSIDISIAKDYLLKENDLLFARTGATVGKTFYYQSSWGIAAFAGYLIRARFSPYKVWPKFISFCTLSEFYWQWVASITSQATIQNVSAEKYATFVLPLPSLAEQQAISDFLDRETGKIDDLIQKREDLIALLQEKRSALISHAVTKGLDPKVKLKPSGIDWLGDIPEHWNVKKLKHCFTISCGSTPQTSEDSYWDGDIIWITPADISRTSSKYIEASANTITLAGFHSCALSLVEPGGIIVSTRAPIGTLAIASKELCHNQGCKSLQKNKHVSSVFVYYHLLSKRDILNIKGKGTTFLELGTFDFGSFDLPFPPFKEQQAIAEYLDRETGKIDDLVEKENELIKKMKEYRTALISAAVTGKIDVRGENYGDCPSK